MADLEHGTFADGTSFSFFTCQQNGYEGKRGVTIGSFPNAITFIVASELVQSIDDVVALGSNKDTESQAAWRALAPAILGD